MNQGSHLKIDDRGAGTITATADINPGGIGHIYDLWVSGYGTTEAQKPADRICEVALRYPLSVALKSVHAELRNELDWRHVHPPLTELLSSEHTELINALSGTGFQFAD